MLCLCNAVIGAPLSSPRIGYDALVLTAFDFGPDAYVGDNEAGFAEEVVPPLISRSEIERADKGTADVVSGKPPLQAAEPPELLMLATGAGLILIFRPRKAVHRPGRRRVKTEDRPMAQV